MPDVISTYNHTRKKLWDLSLTAEAANWKVMLLDGTTPFNAAHTTVAQASDSAADEVYGNGWTQGGQSIAGFATAIASVSGAIIDANDISVMAVGGDIGPASAALIFVNEGGAGTTLTPMFHVAFAAPRTAPVGFPFLVIWNPLGIASSIPA
jgi:hypothetical protein